jgi:hypothetical protein
MSEIKRNGENTVDVPSSLELKIKRVRTRIASSVKTAGSIVCDGSIIGGGGDGCLYGRLRSIGVGG